MSVRSLCHLSPITTHVSVYYILNFSIRHTNFGDIREHAAAMRLPRSMKDVFEVQEVLSTYMSQHSLVIWVFYVSTFIFIQSFAIPGSYVFHGDI